MRAFANLAPPTSASPTAPDTHASARCVEPRRDDLSCGPVVPSGGTVVGGGVPPVPRRGRLRRRGLALDDEIRHARFPLALCDDLDASVRDEYTRIWKVTGPIDDD